LKVRFKDTFARDLRALKDNSVLSRIREAIEKVEKADNLIALGGVKRLRAEGNFYRLRVGDYRIGLVVEQDVAVFVRALHRREVYRYFP
jgi:mRNA interferase RelE/StbE